MKDMIRLLSVFTVLAAAFSAAPAVSQPTQQVGDTTRIIVRYETEIESEVSSSSSRGTYRFVERVLAVTDAGTELEYSIPTEESEQTQRAQWQLPVRVLVQADGDVVITNREELILRREQFLEDAGLTVDSCGSWIFTWNAFQIDCDPDSIIDTVMSLRLQPPELVEGAMITSPYGDQTAALFLVQADDERAVYRAEFAIDPDAARRSAAQSDVAAGEIMGQPTTLEEALAKRNQDQVSGTVTVLLQAGSTGLVHTRIEETALQYAEAGEEPENRRSIWGVRREPL